MTDPGPVDVGLFAASGIFGLPGGLLLSGYYGFPSSPALGIVFLILSATCIAIFVALNEESD